MSRCLRPLSPIAWRTALIVLSSAASLINCCGQTCSHSSCLETTRSGCASRYVRTWNTLRRSRLTHPARHSSWRCVSRVHSPKTYSMGGNLHLVPTGLYLTEHHRL